MSTNKPHTTVATRSSGIRDQWLATIQEEILEPDLAIVDPHHHLWDFRAYPYLLPQLLADTGSGHKIESTVFIECTACYRADGPVELRTVGETEFVNGIAAMSSSGAYGPTRVAAGIVGLVDLTLGARAEEMLRAHMAIAGRRFKGIRHAAAWEDKTPEVHNSHTNPPPHLYRDHPKFREGFAALGRLGLTFDAWLYHPQIPDLTSLARAFPEQPIVLDHVGGPLGLGWYGGKRDEILTSWRRDIRELAACPNVFIKLGGLGMRINGFAFHKRELPPSSQELAAAWRPYVETSIEAFGPARCMFESNFPVDKISGSYAVYWNAFKRLASGASEQDKAALFRDTAKRFYRLDQ
jgi:predicted TIM-barrel fold metal-dependent hydrolase